MEFIKKVLGALYLEKHYDPIEAVEEGQLCLCHINIKEDVVYTVRDILYLSKEETIEEALKMKALADVTLINRGEIIVNEQIIIIERASLPSIEKILDDNDKRETPFKFLLTNEGKMELTNEIHLIVDKADDFFKSGHLLKLWKGLPWDSPVTVAENTGKITKTIEIIAKMRDDELQEFDSECSSNESYEQTKWDKETIKKYNLNEESLFCLKTALVSIS